MLFKVADVCVHGLEAGPQGTLECWVLNGITWNEQEVSNDVRAYQSAVRLQNQNNLE